MARSELHQRHSLKSAHTHSAHCMYELKAYKSVFEQSPASPPALRELCCICDPDLLVEGEDRVSPQGSRNYHITLHLTCLTGDCLGILCLCASWPCQIHFIFPCRIQQNTTDDEQLKKSCWVITNIGFISRVLVVMTKLYCDLGP